MTTPAQGNLSGSSGKLPDAGFEASGLSPEEAERFAAAFKPSWELDEAPFTQGNGGLGPSQIDALAREPEQARAYGSDSRIVPPHAPPHRVETHEPEVSVIIDRSITAAEMDAHRSAHAATARPAAVAPAPLVAPAFPAPPPQRVAPVMRAPRSADDSLELPASLKKSNKGLFIGLGVAVAGAALVLVVAHGAMSSSSDTTAGTSPPPPTATATAAAEITPRSPVPIPPPPIATAPPAPTQAALAPAPPPPSVALAVATTPAPQRSAVVATPKAPPPPRAPVAPVVVHHAAPKTPPKAAGGGIVRDNPF